MDQNSGKKIVKLKEKQANCREFAIFWSILTGLSSKFEKIRQIERKSRIFRDGSVLKISRPKKTSNSSSCCLTSSYLTNFFRILNIFTNSNFRSKMWRKPPKNRGFSLEIQKLVKQQVSKPDLDMNSAKKKKNSQKINFLKIGAETAENRQKTVPKMWNTHLICLLILYLSQYSQKSLPF